MSDIINIADVRAALERFSTRLENVSGNFDKHDRRDDERFEKMFGYLQTSFDKLDARFDSTDTKIDDLQAYKNQQTGAMASAKMLGSMIAGFFGVAVGALATYFGGKQ